MRIATWNVNSLKARMEAVEKWLVRAEPDVLLIQETKLADAEAPVMPLRMLGYELVHHGEGRWNGVAILTRVGARRRRSRTSATGRCATRRPGRPWRCPRTTSTRSTRRGCCPPCAAGSGSCASTRRTGASWTRRSTRASSAGSSGCRAGSTETRSTDEPLVAGRRLQRDAGARGRLERDAGRTAGPTCRPRSARRWPGCATGASWTRTGRSGPSPERFSWWDYRAGMFHRNEGMRIDLLYATAPVAERVVWAEIDREARKGPPTPSDHAPVVIDLDEPGKPFDRRLGGRAPADRGEDHARAADPGPERLSGPGAGTCAPRAARTRP